MSVWVADIKMLLRAETRTEAKAMAKAVVAWVEGTYQMMAAVEDIQALPEPGELPPGWTPEEGKHNLHMAIFGPQEGCPFCRAVANARR